MEIFDFNSYMTELVYTYVSGVKRVGSNKLNFRCPICGDGKKQNSHRGWFYSDTGSYYCWNAGCIANDRGMSGLRFLSLVSGKSVNEIKNELISLSNHQISGAFNKEIKSMGVTLFDDEDETFSENSAKTKKIIQDKIELDEWTEVLPDFVKKYIDERKLLKAPFLPKDFRFYYDKKMKRLVIPWTDDYYQERTILKSQSKEDKYKFPPGIEKPIFGMPYLDPNFKYVFLCEGVFDSIWVKNALAVGSLTLSHHQKTILDPIKKDYQIIYMPDNQFLDNSSKEKTMKMCKDFPYENVFIWPETLKKFKDINETIIYSDKFIELWQNEKFLTKNIFNGVKALMTLKKTFA